MSECDDCELRGYSRELCLVHIRHCRKHPQPRAASPPLKLSAKVAGGVAVGVTAGLLVATAASFVGGAAVLHALLLKLVAGTGLVGGGWGLARGMSEMKEQQPRVGRPTRRQLGRGTRVTRVARGARGGEI